MGGQPVQPLLPFADRLLKLRHPLCHPPTEGRRDVLGLEAHDLTLQPSLEVGEADRHLAHVVELTCGELCLAEDSALDLVLELDA